MEKYASSQARRELLKSVLRWLYFQFVLYFMSLLGSLRLQHFIYPGFTLTLLIVTDLRKLLDLKNLYSLFIHVASISVMEMIISPCCIPALVLPGQLA